MKKPATALETEPLLRINLLPVSIEDNSVGNPIFSSEDGNLHNFFHYSAVETVLVKELLPFRASFPANPDNNSISFLRVFRRTVVSP